MRQLSSIFDTALLAAALVSLAIGGILYLLGANSFSRFAFTSSVVVVLIPTAVSTLRRLLRGEIGVDLIAVLAMGGALALGEYLAGAVIAVMLTGGTTLERFAVARARRELSALIKRAPTRAHRRAGGDIIDIAVDEVALGDLLIVKPGEVVPVDGIITASDALLDESALTGESKPVKLEAGAPLRSGGTNAGGPFEMRVTASAADSTYAGIVRLVRAAEASKAPLQRLADRYALGFLARSPSPLLPGLAKAASCVHSPFSWSPRPARSFAPHPQPSSPVFPGPQGTELS